MAAHARLSPSGADRWMTCPASVRATEGLPDTSSPWAREGTAAHEVREMCLSFGLDVEDFLGAKIVVKDGDITDTYEVTQDWVRHLQPGIDRVREFGGELYVEYRVNLDHWLPGNFGTLDTGIITKKYIVINDLKFGAGEAVSPIENKQLMIYALGFWENVARHQTDAEEFIISIDQPRADGGGGEWRTNLDDLLKFGKEVRRAGKATLDPDAPFKASIKGCRWCKKSGNCRVEAEFLFKQGAMKFRNLDEAAELGIAMETPNASLLSVDRKVTIYKHAKAIKRFLDTVEQQLLADAIAGRPTPGVKAVAGRMPHRKWRDAAEAERLLLNFLPHHKAFNYELRSPAQAEEILSNAEWSKFDGLVDEGSPKPTLVSETDRRAAIPSTKSKFRNLDENP